jgi:hypothetical protein
MVTPGKYSVSLSKLVDGEITELSQPQSFDVKPLREGALEGASTEEIRQYRLSLAKFQQDIQATGMELEKSLKKVKVMQTAVRRVDRESNELEARIFQVEKKLQAINRSMNGSPSISEVMDRQDPTPTSRLYFAINGLTTTYGPTEQHKTILETGISELSGIKTELAEIIDTELPQLEKDLKEAGAPWIEGQGLIRD